MAVSYAPKRPAVGKKKRLFLYERDGRLCQICGLLIKPGHPFEIDHTIPRELGGSDGDENLHPVHHECHKEKSKADVKAISKSNRIRRSNGPPALRRKTPHPIRTRKTNWPTRKFQQRQNR